MSALDKFLNFMKVNDDEGFGDDYLDDEYDDYDDYEDDRPRKRILQKNTRDEYDEPVSSQVERIPAQADKAQTAARPKAKPARQAKISPMRSAKRGGMEVCVIRPKSMEDAREITETLLDECTVVLNMEGLDLDIAQRIIDFASGSCYAMHGNLQKISNYIFIITPESVDISGDFQEILSGAFDVPSFGTRF